MQALIRIGTVLQYPLIAWLVLVVSITDLPSAWNAQPCPAPNCYPWTTEGPSGEYWNYASKRLYLTSGIFDALTAAVALATWFLLPKGRRFLAIVIAVLLISTASFWLPAIV